MEINHLALLVDSPIEIIRMTIVVPVNQLPQLAKYEHLWREQVSDQSHPQTHTNPPFELLGHHPLRENPKRVLPALSGAKPARRNLSFLDGWTLLLTAIFNSGNFTVPTTNQGGYHQNAFLHTLRLLCLTGSKESQQKLLQAAFLWYSMMYRTARSGLLRKDWKIPRFPRATVGWKSRLKRRKLSTFIKAMLRVQICWDEGKEENANDK